jgi:hypothetical protein
VQAHDAAGTIEQGSRLEEQTARIVIRRAAFETAELRILVPVDIRHGAGIHGARVQLGLLASLIIHSTPSAADAQTILNAASARMLRVSYGVM